MLYEFTHHFDRWRAELHGGGGGIFARYFIF
jgi:hypothetical protein